ncbi:glutamine synthetase family protein [Streptomyces syringium]|uniref:glutamine synthetase family protein n=1 Tax=Streptomyces syringium TaxID=76729 RepID=UPI003452C341
MPTSATQPSAEPGPTTKADQLRQLIETGRIGTVLLAVPDLQGRLKGKAHDAPHYLEHIAGNGAEACAYVLATDVDMRPVDGYPLASWDTGYGDLRLMPDPQTLRILPWTPKAALVFADAVDTGGQPVEIAPRQVLRQQLAELAQMGMTAKVGLEAEFFLYPRDPARIADGRPLAPVSPDNLDYALDHPTPLAPYLRTLPEHLRAAGMPVEAVKTEGAPGQVEVTFPYGDPLQACDNHLVFKHGARAVAHEQGLVPTFMAAPATDLASGLHIHLSLWNQDKPVLADSTGALSPTALQVVAGLLNALPQLTPLYAPTSNSYRRYRPASFAPTHFTWGHDNRTCAVRVSGHGRGRHLEIRLPGADANPYLALAAVLAATLHGIRQALTPPSPITGNAYQATGHTPIPASLEQALTAYTKGHLAAHLLTPPVARHYQNAAQVELDALRYAVPDTERQRGFTRA